MLAVQSVPQTVNEIIISNDGAQLVQPDILFDQRVKVVQSGPRSGPAVARNVGARVASGEILFFLDDDDQFLPGYIDRVMSLLASTFDILCGFSAVIEIEDGIAGRVKRRLDKSSVISRSSPRALIHAASAGFWINKDVFFELGGFDEKLRVDEDTDFCLRLTKAGFKVWYEAEPGVRFRVKSGSNQEEQKISEKSILSDVAYESYQRTYFKHFPTAKPMIKLFLLSRTIRRGMKDLGQTDEAIFQGLNIFWWCMAKLIKLKYKTLRY